MKTTFSSLHLPSVFNKKSMQGTYAQLMDLARAADEAQVSLYIYICVCISISMRTSLLQLTPALLHKIKTHLGHLPPINGSGCGRRAVFVIYVCVSVHGWLYIYANALLQLKSALRHPIKKRMQGTYAQLMTWHTLRTERRFRCIYMCVCISISMQTSFLQLYTCPPL